MTSRLPPHALSLKRFFLRQEVIKLYREAFRVIHSVEDPTQKQELATWTREEFRRNKLQEDEGAIKVLLLHGRQTLKEMQQAVSMAR